MLLATFADTAACAGLKVTAVGAIVSICIVNVNAPQPLWIFAFPAASWNVPAATLITPFTVLLASGVNVAV